MNTLISAVVGALAASAVLIGGVHVVDSGQKPVADNQLYTYSNE